MARNASVPILGGRAQLLEPTESYRSWRASFKDPITLKRRMTTGNTREKVESKVAALLGDYVADPQGVRAPTVKEVFDRWINSKRSGWSPRTVDAYTYLAQRFLKPFGGLAITALRP